MIDIIVPIYEGFEQTKECIESIKQFYDSSKERIILINDCSPNEDIVKLLEEIKLKNFFVLTNEFNLGFIKTVNRGMALSQKNDVILLNSDTVVTKNWSTKMKNAAYSSSKIGTVTSLTNNGTIASVPLFNQDNEIPKGFNIDSFAALIENTSKKWYPIVPTCVGHCTYIRRELINKIGFLDFETFGKGYGEEEDFSARSILAGYKNILADDTFIFHYGGTSFGEEKKSHIEKNKKKLHKKYKWYAFNVKRFLIFDKKVRKICNNIQYAARIQSVLKKRG